MTRRRLQLPFSISPLHGLLAAAVLVLPAPAAHAQRAVALQGEPAPGGGGGSFGTQFAPSLGASGDVAWRAMVSGGSVSEGVFLESGSGVVAVALSGDSAPDTGGASYSAFGEPAVDASGRVAFRAQLSGGTASWGLFRYDAGVVSTLATSQSTAPGTGGGNYSAFGARLAINASGEVAFFANVGGGTTTGGIFVEDGTTGSAVFLLGDAVPPGVAGTYFNLSPPAINDAGEVAATASIALDAGGFTSGVVAARGSGDVYAARIGDAAPDTGGGTYSNFLFTAPPGIDASGGVYFRADVSGGTTARGLFVDAAGVDSAVVLEGDTPPDAGGSFLFFSDTGLSVNAVGEAGYSANLIGGSAGQGLFVSSTFAANEALALLGDTAPDTGGATFVILGDSPSINGADGAAFRAFYSGATSGWGVFAVPEPTGMGAWTAPGGLLVLLARRRGARRAARTATSSSSRGTRRCPRWP